MSPTPTVSHPDQYRKRPEREYTALDIPDALWPSDNPLDIPALRMDLQARQLDLPVSMWGYHRRRAAVLGGTVGFYVDDYQFNALYQKPYQLLNAWPVNVIEPNFSVGPDTPLAEAIFQIYRKRWLSRTWQEVGGVRVFVDLNVPRDYDAINLYGVPDGWSAFATRGHSDDLEAIRSQYELAQSVLQAGPHYKAGDLPLFVVYSGGKAAKALCTELPGAVYIADHMDVMHSRPLASP